MNRWEELAQLDPLFVILTDKENAHGRWDLDAFFETGREEVDELFDRMQAVGITLPEEADVLDFGCGVGRLSQALARRGLRVTGVDIAPRMIELGRELSTGREACDYRLNGSPDLALFEDDRFDLVLTSKVLFHLKPALQFSYLREFFRVLRPGGALVFGASIYAPAGSRLQAFEARHKNLRRLIFNRQLSYYLLRGLGFRRRWLYQRLGLRPMMPMRTLDEERLQEVVDTCGGETLAVDKVRRRHRMNAMWYVRTAANDGEGT